MKARVVALILVGLVATACQAGPTPSPNPGGDEIVIASDLPVFAPGRLAALPVQQAIQLAIDKHPTIGRYKLRYRSYDDTLSSTYSSPAKGLQNVKHMIGDASVLGMIGPFNSAVAYEEIPVANAADLVMLSPSNTNPCLTVAAPSCSKQPAALRPSGPNNYFRIAAPDSVQGRAMARYAAQTLQVRRVAAFAENPWEPSTIDSLEAELGRLGGTVVFRADYLAPGTSNFTEFLATAKARGAEAIYAATSDDNACAARAQMKGSFPDDAFFLGIDGILTSNCIAAAMNNAEGIFATAADYDPEQHSTDATLNKVVNDYRKAHPKSPDMLPPYTFAAYDCALILIDAIKRAIDANGGAIPTRLQVVNAVARSQFTGVTGTYSFDGNGDAVSPPMSLYQLQGGKWVYLRQIDASSQSS